VGTSIGLVPIDERWISPASLIEAADSACYAAKEAGRNCVHLWLDRDRASRRRQGGVQWSTRLVNAMQDGSFELHAQRLVPLSGIRAGLDCEVLLRMRDGMGGFVLPGAFLPPAERFHLMGRIDRWVLGEVLALMSRERDPARLPSRISVNLSGQSIADPAFLRDMLESVRRAGVDATRLCIEIREAAAVANLVDTRTFIDAAREIGVRIAIDNFGSSASSFGYLRNLGVDLLKFDPQYVQGFLRDPLDAAALRSFMDVAQAMGLETVAKGVEDQAVMQAMQSLSVDHVQGNFAHVPESLAQLLRCPQVALMSQDPQAPAGTGDNQGPVPSLPPSSCPSDPMLLRPSAS
jgi:EAL domain-containing protein (putative c-di-GMP-specific phosphodiesterase class I)